MQYYFQSPKAPSKLITKYTHGKIPSWDTHSKYRLEGAHSKRQGSGKKNMGQQSYRGSFLFSGQSQKFVVACDNHYNPVPRKINSVNRKVLYKLDLDCIMSILVFPCMRKLRMWFWPIVKKNRIQKLKYYEHVNKHWLKEKTKYAPRVIF